MVVSALGYAAISRGGVYVQHNWLEPALVRQLRQDVARLDSAGEFAPSGVATAGIDGSYSSKSDRRVCVLSDCQPLFESRLDGLTHELRRALCRPTLECAERYYSISTSDAQLSLHMDERHEETKGERAWLLPTRRSISWLCYLSDDGWGEEAGAGSGGELQAFCRRGSPLVRCGAHEGNLQVGWLDGRSDDDADDPVFLDSCFWDEGAGASDVGEAQPRAALYTVRGSSGGERRYVTRGFGPESPSWAAASAAASTHSSSADGGQAGEAPGMAPAAFAEALRAQLPPPLRPSFSSVEAVPHRRQRATRVAPTGGTLVLFDSVAVPHAVLPVVRGERLALAGWLHEAQDAEEEEEEEEEADYGSYGPTYTPMYTPSQ